VAERNRNFVVWWYSNVLEYHENLTLASGKSYLPKTINYNEKTKKDNSFLTRFSRFQNTSRKKEMQTKLQASPEYGDSIFISLVGMSSFCFFA
jgi:hypothetical protein